MKNSFRKFLRLALAVASLVSCEQDDPVVPPSDKPQPGTYLLPLIETTDMHGYIVYSGSDRTHFRLAYLANKVKDIRGRKEQYKKEHLLLLDGGDIYQGASISNLLSGQPLYTAMDLMGYDAVAVGNHEFDWDFEDMVDPDATMPDYEWNGIKYQNKVPVVCANLYRDGSRSSRTRDYVIVEKSAVNAQGKEVPVKIGIVGFAPNYASSIMTSKFTGKGYTIEENYSIANDIAAELEASGQCDATILLTHGAADYAAGELGRSSVIDLVLGGHSHSTMSGRTGGKPFLQGGRYCEHYAYADLKFTVNREGNVSFTSVENQDILSVNAALDVETDRLDGDILAVSQKALWDISRELNDVIGHINVGATTYYINGERATTMSNWMCDILRRIGEADVSFVNSGGVRTTIPLNGQAARDITVANVYEMFPFSNTTYVYSITYADLLRLLKYALTSGGGSLFSFMTGIDCYYTAQDTVYSLKKDGTVIYQNGKWTGDWASRTLILAVSEYLATSQREDYTTGQKNPLPEWNETQKLLYDSLIDNENAVRVLREEAAQSGGLLSIDTAPHFILH